MSIRAVIVGAVVLGGAVLAGVLVTVDPSGVTETPAETAGAIVASTPWGEPDLAGVWKGESLGAVPGRDTFNLTQLEALYTPEARAVMDQLSAADDPTLGCLPLGFPRAAMLGQAIQIIQSPGFAFIFTEAYPTYRIIPTTGGPHTPEQYLFPTHMGDATARWENDTLVVDVISFKGQVWLASGQDRPTTVSTGVWPTSPEMHVVERWRRVDADTLEYRARVEDPQMLAMPWETPVVTLTRQVVDKIEEALCLLEDGPASYLARLGR